MRDDIGFSGHLKEPGWLLYDSGRIESSRHNWQLLMDALHPFCFLADG